MNRPQLIISFDCEGKWGMADHLSDHHVRHLTNEKLNDAYDRIVELLHKHGIRATFAFVAAFTLSWDEYRETEASFHDVPVGGKNWLERFRQDVAARVVDGWFNPTALEIVRMAPGHELATHGFTHVPLAEDAVGRETFEHEIGQARRIARRKGYALKTIVYPRNRVGYTGVLASYGIQGYRACRFDPRHPLAKFRPLLSEFNILERAQRHAEIEAQTVSIPAGFFLNWRSGLRKRVPEAVTLRRWSHIVEDAVSHNRVVHLWTHPHNFIDGKGQFDLFARVLALAAPAVRAGELENCTQAEYCASRKGTTAAGAAA